MKINMEINAMLNKTKYFCVILLAGILIVQGCSYQNEPEKLNVKPNYPESWQSDVFAQRFQESNAKSPSVVESAIELSDKYARLIEESSVLKQQNQSLASRNEQLRAQVVDIESKMKQTQEELKEANEFLVEMRVELNNWKTDVLGFREEMRSAQSAQLQALLKVLKALGGDSAVETARSNGIGQAVAANKK